MLKSGVIRYARRNAASVHQPSNPTHVPRQQVLRRGCRRAPAPDAAVLAQREDQRAAGDDGLDGAQVRLPHAAHLACGRQGQDGNAVGTEVGRCQSIFHRETNDIG